MAAAETVTVTVEWRCPLLPDQRRTNLIEELVASTAAAERSTSVHIRRGPHMKTYTKNGGLENDRDGLHITAEFQSPTTMRWVNFTYIWTKRWMRMEMTSTFSEKTSALTPEFSGEHRQNYPKPRKLNRQIESARSEFR